MIIMPVPKDIRKFEPKFLGPLSKRQAFAVLPAAAIGGFLFMTFGNAMSQEALITLVGVIDIPILACGFLDMYGMPLYFYAKEVAINKILAPRYRPYATENTFAKYGEQTKITYEFFDGDTEEYTEKQMKKKQKENKKRLEQFLKDNPELQPIE